MILLALQAPTKRALIRRMPGRRLRGDEGGSHALEDDASPGCSAERSYLNWDLGYQRFLAYPAASRGQRTVPVSFVTAEGYRLGLWQENQRARHKQGLLSSERSQRLEDAGIVWDLHEAAWLEGVDQLAAVSPDAQGRRQVPSDFVTPAGYRLGQWQDNQRYARRHGALSEERVAKVKFDSRFFPTCHARPFSPRTVSRAQFCVQARVARDRVGAARLALAVWPRAL